MTAHRPAWEALLRHLQATPVDACASDIELARAIGVSNAVVSNAIVACVGDGLLRRSGAARRNGKGDEGTRVLSLTRKGRAAIGLAAAPAECNRRLVALVPASLARALHRAAAGAGQRADVYLGQIIAAGWMLACEDDCETAVQP